METDQELLANIKARLPALTALWEDVNSHWGYEDPIYRFYHHSFKVYWVQNSTQKIIEALKMIAPEGQGFCAEFQELCEAGAAGKQFEYEHNQNWTAHTRPLVEAFLHARYFLEMAVKYGNELETSPSLLPSGWAALLCLYDIR